MVEGEGYGMAEEMKEVFSRRRSHIFWKTVYTFITARTRKRQLQWPDRNCSTIYWHVVINDQPSGHSTHERPSRPLLALARGPFHTPYSVSDPRTYRGEIEA